MSRLLRKAVSQSVMEALERRELMSVTMPSGVTLNPGTGFSATPVQPAPINPTAQYGKDLAIANWDAVPYQTFNGNIDIGVVAFHSAGINEVSFSVNGGAWTQVGMQSANPQTGAVEYWATLNAAQFTDGAVQVEAIAYPNVGVPKVLAPLTLYANSDNKLTGSTVYVSTHGSDSNLGTQTSPFATIAEALSTVTDDGTVVLENAGTYTMGTVNGKQARWNSQWITIEAGPGLNRSQVVITSVGGEIVTRIQRLKFEGVTMDWANGILLSSGAVWFDNSIWTYSSALSTHFPGASVKQGTQGTFITNCLADHVVYGFISCTLVRNSEIENLSGNALANTQTTINVTVHEFDGPVALNGTGEHPDVFQMWGAKDNMIVYGLTTWDVMGASGLFIQPTPKGRAQVSALTNSAFVNVTLEPNNSGGKGGVSSQLQDTLTNLLFQNVVTPDQTILFRTTFSGVNVWNATNVVFQNCVFNPTQKIDGITGVTFTNCLTGTPQMPNWQPPAGWGLAITSLNSFLGALNTNAQQPDSQMLKRN